MKYIIRNKSIITEKENLEHLYTFKDFPVFIWCTEKQENTDLLADMSFSICKDSWIIQLDKILPLDLIYSEYHSEALWWIWKEHHQEFAKYLAEFTWNDILEIWWWNWYLAKNFLEKNKDKNRTIIEPTPNTKSEWNLIVIAWIFDNIFKIEKSIDTITHSHVFEHIYNPLEFMWHISNFQKDWDKHIFSVPNLFKYLENHFTNCINFEHTIFLTEYFIDYLLNLYWYEIINKKYFKEHSIYYTAIKKSNIKKIELKSKYVEYKKMFEEYLIYNNKIIKSINKKIQSFDWKIYLFGAHVFSQYLIHQWINTEKIIWIMDNSIIKEWKRLYWSKYTVFNPKILQGEKKIWIILRAGQYQEEIRKQLLEINPNIEIWE